MSNAEKKTMLSAYVEQAPVQSFLSGLFQSPAGNYFNTPTVEIDIERSGEDVAIALKDASTGYRLNTFDKFSNKEFTPPAYKEAVAINAFDLLSRTAGDNPFAQKDFRADLITRVFKAARKIQAKIGRAVELQASQILTTGELTLTDADSATVYTLDYQPDSDHFADASYAWDNASAVPLTDLESLAAVIRGDGKMEPDQLIFGSDSWNAFISDTTVQAVFENRRIDMGTIAPMQMRGGGGQYRGFVEIANYRFDCWTYNGFYTDPATGAATAYVPGDKVIMRASQGRLDAVFGAIPNIGQILGAQNIVRIPELPSRLMNTSGGMDLFVNTWLSLEGENFFAGFGARPLLIPTAIDTIGCLDTGL